MAVCSALVQIESMLQTAGLRNKFLHACKSCKVHTMLLQEDSQSGSWEGAAGVWLVPASPREPWWLSPSRSLTPTHLTSPQPGICPHAACGSPVAQGAQCCCPCQVLHESWGSTEAVCTLSVFCKSSSILCHRENLLSSCGLNQSGSSNF